MADDSSKMVKAYLKDEDGGKTLAFKFNPTEYSVKKSGSWNAPGRSMGTKGGAKPNYLGSNPQSVSLQIFLESVSAKYIMFKSDGTPVRATADISLKEIPTDPPPTNPTSGSIHARRSHLIAQGDTLQSIANREYGKPGLWRGLAAFNDIDDPLRLQLGSHILLPSMEEAAEQGK